MNLRDTITPYPTGRAFRGGAVPGTSCQATIAPSPPGLKYVMRPAFPLDLENPAKAEIRFGSSGQSP